MQKVTFTWKDDALAGAIPAHVYYSSPSDDDPSPIGKLPCSHTYLRYLTTISALVFHAGGFVLGDTDLIPRNQIAGLVARGFVVVTPEYRLCPQLSLYDGPIQDAKDVYKWCQQSLAKLMKSVDVHVDSSRIVAMGHSAGAQLALNTGLCPNPPRAIVDFYGCKLLDDPFWTRPTSIFAQIPEQLEEHTSKVFAGKHAISSVPLFVNGKPALDDPRCAWFIMQMKNGSSISSIVPDGDYRRVDAAMRLTHGFPPTYFFHGTSDIFVDLSLTVRTHETLRSLGVETKLDVGDQLGHVFDFNLLETDPLFVQHVVPALDFLQRHV